MNLSTRSLICTVGLVILVGGTALQPAHGQEEASSSGGAGFVAFGVERPGIEALNERLSERGYPTFGQTMFSFGGGGYGLVGSHVMIGGEGHGLIDRTQSYQAREVTVGGGYGLATLGYWLSPSVGLSVFPQVGIGGGTLILDIGSAGGDSFDDVLQNPDRRARLKRTSLLLQFSAGASYQVPRGEGGGLRIGVQVGYLLSPYSREWQLDEHSANAGPDATLAGPFVRLLVGGGGHD